MMPNTKMSILYKDQFVVGYVKQTYDGACTETLKLFQFIVTFRNTLQLALCATSLQLRSNTQMKFRSFLKENCLDFLIILDG